MPNVEDEQHIVLPGAPPATSEEDDDQLYRECRATSYDLPKDIMHVYGYIQEKDKASARMHWGWDQFTLGLWSAQRSFVKTNLEALRRGTSRPSRSENIRSRTRTSSVKPSRPQAG